MSEPVAGKPQTRGQEFALGWPVIVGALLCYAVSIAAIPTYTNGVFMTELTKEFGWTRGQFSSAGLAHTAVLVPMAPLVGLVADRFGIRWPIAISMVGMAVLYVLKATVMDSFLFFVLLTGGAAFIGAASLPVVFTRAVNSWFDQARGLALGCTLVGTGVTATIGPGIVAWLIDRYDWHVAYIVLACAMLAMTPFIVWTVRLAPWDAGGGATPKAGKVAEGESLGEAVRQAKFWIMGAAFFIQALATLGLVGHFVPMLTDAGVSITSAAQTVGLVGIAIILGRFCVGALLDHLFAPWVAAVVAAVCLLGTLTLLYGGIGFAPLAAFTLGFAVGAEVDIIGFLASRYFGLKAYGRIYGSLYGLFLLGSGISAFWIGAVFDAMGSYDMALLVSCLMLAVVIVLVMLLPRYAPPVSAQQQPA
jgi:MFS family permease